MAQNAIIGTAGSCTRCKEPTDILNWYKVTHTEAWLCESCEDLFELGFVDFLLIQ